MAASKTLKQFIRGNPEVSDDNKSDIWSDGSAVNSAASVGRPASVTSTKAC